MTARTIISVAKTSRISTVFGIHVVRDDMIDVTVQCPLLPAGEVVDVNSGCCTGCGTVILPS